jgi:guanylate kinase
VEEIQQAEHYDYIVTNNDLAQAVAEVKAIVTAEKCRAAQQWPAVRQKLLSL